MDQDILSSLAQLSNNELLARLERLAQGEREATAFLIVHLAVLDERRLYLGEGYSSMFSYCTQVLHFSEHAAYGRIEAARTGRRFPLLLEMLEDGSVNLTTVCMLTARLTYENHRELLAAARHRSKRQVEELLARLRPQPPVAATVRRLPAASQPLASPTMPDGAVANDELGASTPLEAPLPTPPPARPAIVEPLAPQRYRIQFTASAETCDKLRLAQDLLRHQIPDGDPAKIFDRALSALLENLARQKLAATDRPRAGRGTAPGSRHIPADVKRAVWIRDGGRCAFVAGNGRRCAAQGFLEFHHVTPHAAGGEPTAANIQLRCRGHNGYEADLFFGPRKPDGVRETRALYRVPRFGPSSGACLRGPQAPG
jgi:hypothetical protein